MGMFEQCPQQQSGRVVKLTVSPSRRRLSCQPVGCNSRRTAQRASYRTTGMPRYRPGCKGRKMHPPILVCILLTMIMSAVDLAEVPARVQSAQESQPSFLAQTNVHNQLASRTPGTAPKARELKTAPDRVLSVYPNLAPEGPMQLKIRVDLVPIGFEGFDGNLLEIPRETLDPWLKHLMSVAGHVTVGQSVPEAQAGTTNEGEPSPQADHLASEIRYAYEFHIVKVDKQVHLTLTAQMRTYMRDEDRTDDSVGGDEGIGGGRGEMQHQPPHGRQMYMPSWHMESILGSLATALNRETDDSRERTTPPAFTLFILNPDRKWAFPGMGSDNMNWEHVTYGYRCGLSSSAMKALAMDEAVVARAKEVERRGQETFWRKVVKQDESAGFEFREPLPSSSADPAATGRRVGTESRVVHRDEKAASRAWGIAHMITIPERDEDAESGDGLGNQDWSTQQEAKILLQGDADEPLKDRTRSLLRDILEEHRRSVSDNKINTNSKGTRDGRSYSDGNSSMRGTGCLTEAWVSGDRFGWVDLQAGPFEWGPACGGAGYKSATSEKIPHRPQKAVETHELPARLAALVSSVARAVVTPASTLPLPIPPPRSRVAEYGRQHAGNDVNHAVQGDKLPRESNNNDESRNRRTGSNRRLPTGPALVNPKEVGAGANPGGSEAFPRAGMEAAHPLLLPPPPSAMDFFVPDSLVLTLYVVRAQDVYFPLGKPSRASEGQKRGDGDKDRMEGADREGGSSGFDLPAFQAGALSLKLPNQQASFTTFPIEAEKEKIFATALASAKRESRVNVVSPAGQVRRERRVWIDAESIHHQLQERKYADHTGGSGGYSGSGSSAAEAARRDVQHVSIYLFSLAGPDSVYVDEHWRARAVGGDTVVVVQSETRRDASSPLTCGGKTVEEDPKNPMRQALMALGSIVGGLVPSQDSWDEAHNRVVQDWTWSMSESPMSPLVPHARFSQVDKDVIYRTQFVRALRASVQLTSAASDLLYDALSQKFSSEAIMEGEFADQLKEAHRLLGETRQRRRVIMDAVDLMLFDVAARKLNPLLDDSRRAYKQARQLASDMYETLNRQKTAKTSATVAAADEGMGWLRLSFAVLASAGALWALGRKLVSKESGRRRRKIKVN